MHVIQCGNNSQAIFTSEADHAAYAHWLAEGAERFDGAFYFSLADMVVFTLLGSLALTLIDGIDPQAITVFLLITVFLGIFQHANISTPRWLGYIIQRPESHAVHHARRVHFKNFSDFPIFDIIFGTFENPKGYDYEAGIHTPTPCVILRTAIFPCFAYTQAIRTS